MWTAVFIVIVTSFKQKLCLAEAKLNFFGDNFVVFFSFSGYWKHQAKSNELNHNLLLIHKHTKTK